MSLAKKNELKPVTRSNVSSSYGRSSISPTRRSASGSRVARERDQRLGGVEPVRLAAALGDEAQERADAAADVEHAPARLEPERARSAAS